jgi:hypothetical protein
MPKQSSKSARDDSSAGKSTAPVSSATDAGAVAASKPEAVVQAALVVDHAVADDTVLDRAALLAVIKDMLDDLPGMIAELEYNARSSAQDRDHSEHAFYARLASVFGEFRNGLTTALNAPQV